MVSHDRNFCDKIQFTHIATVKDGTFKLEERSVRDSDWIVNGLSSSTAASNDSEGSKNSNGANASAKAATKELDPKLRKAAYNAPKRIKKLETMIEEAENKMSELDELMLSNGNDVGKLTEWSKERQQTQKKVDGYMKEWNELEELLAQVAAAMA